jgi:hypothetical protein
LVNCSILYRRRLSSSDPNSPPPQAQDTLTTILDALVKTSHPEQLSALANAIKFLGPKTAPGETERAVEVLKTALGTTDEPATAAALAGAIAALLPMEPRETYVAGIIEFLKWPTIVGPATDVLLEVLHERVPGAPSKEAGLDATVAWVAATYPDIDLDSPPTFPASGSTGGAW